VGLSASELIQHLSSCSCCLKTDIGQEDFGFYSIKERAISIVYQRFPTHLPTYINSKGVPGKYYKISGQSIYSGQMHPVVRAKLMDGLKERFSPAANNLYKVIRHKSAPMLRKVGLTLEYGIPLNYGDVRMIKGKISWKPVSPMYSPRWDISNLWPMRKAIEDAMVDAKLITDDNVAYVPRITERFREVMDLNDRYIRIILTKP